MTALKNNRHCRRRRRPRRGHVVGDDTALYLPGPLGQSKGTGTRSTAVGLTTCRTEKAPETAQTGRKPSWSCGAGQGNRGREPEAGDHGGTARPIPVRPPPSPRKRLRGPFRSRRQTSASPQLDGAGPGAGARVPAAPGEPTAPSRPPPPLVPPTPLTRLEPATREGPGCALAGSGRRGVVRGPGAPAAAAPAATSPLAAAGSSSKFP